MRNLPPPARDRDREDLQRGVRSYMYKGEQRGHAITEAEIDGNRCSDPTFLVSV